MHSSSYVFDTCSLCDLPKFLPLPLWNLPPPGSLIIIPPFVQREALSIIPKLVRKGDWTEDFSFMFRNWLESGTIARLRGQEDAFVKELLRPHPRRPKIHRGEAEAIAIAVHRGVTLVTDNPAARRTAERYKVRVISAEEFAKEWLSRYPC